MLEIIGIIYAAISIVASVATVIMMRGRDWNILAAIGAGAAWPILVYVALRKEKPNATNLPEREAR